MTNNKSKGKMVPFLKFYPRYNVASLPSWVTADIKHATISPLQPKSILMPDGRRYYMDNKLNHLSGQEWTTFINSVLVTRYPTRGRESYAHDIRKIHPTPKPPQLMRDIISFFTKENETVADIFMGVGGTLLGAALCGRKGIGIDLNETYLAAYHEAAKALGLKEFKTYCADCISILKSTAKCKRIFKEPVSLLLIDPPYGNMMARKKTGADMAVYGQKATPFTNKAEDLGNMDIPAFLNALQKAVELTLPYIKPHGHIVVFIKDLQPKGKQLNMLHYDIANKINEIDGMNYKGMRIWADATAKLFPYGYPFSFVANQIHQYILVFRKEK